MYTIAMINYQRIHSTNAPAHAPLPTLRPKRREVVLPTDALLAARQHARRVDQSDVLVGKTGKNGGNHGKTMGKTMKDTWV